MTRHPPMSLRVRQHGFTIVELMVGMLLALMTTVIIAAVLTRAEGTRRSTTEGSDAQVNGALSLYALQRDIQMAGYGVVNSLTAESLGCTIQGGLLSAAVTNGLVPALINRTATGNNSDTLEVLRSGADNYAVPLLTSAVHATGDTRFHVQSRLGVQTGDLMMAIPESGSTSACQLFTVKDDGTWATDTTGVPHATDSAWNTSAAISAIPTYTTGSTLIRVAGLVWTTYQWDASSNALVLRDRLTGTTTTVGNNIVLFKAYYGKDASGTGNVNAYDQTTPTTASGWKAVRTIRVMVVARSSQREKTAVTTANPTVDVGTATTMSGTSTCGTSKCLTLQISPTSGTDTEWQHYRYKVFDTVVPLRNILWSS